MNKNHFFTLSDGREAFLYTLVSTTGFQVQISDYGATLISILTPDRDGKLTDVILGFANPSDYENNTNTYMGATVGRFANRIAGGKFTIDGKEYQLAHNDSGRSNAIHGVDSYAVRLWSAEIINDQEVRMCLQSPDGDGGLPGNAQVAVTFRVEENTLCIEYAAETDAPTIINMTNHSYFNLAGTDAVDCSDQVVFSKADSYLEVDENLIPTGKIIPVAGTAFDLQSGREMQEVYNDARIPTGFDHNFILSRRAGTMLKDAMRIVSKKTGITMSVDTDQPGVQFYSGYWTQFETRCGKNSKKFAASNGLCLEAQNWPDAINHTDFPNSIFRPGETYTQKTYYRFGRQ